MSYKVAVVGATGNVGREILKILSERRFPASEVVALASHKSVGKEVSYGEVSVLKVQDLNKYDFADTDIVLSSAGSSVSKEFAPRAAAAGAVVIDNTSLFRMEPNIALVIPEVNASALKDFRKTNIIANPNCSTMQMLVALKPLHDVAKIKRIVVSTYQSVSGAGKEGMDELFDQTKALFMNSSKEPEKFTKRIAFNVIPHIDVFMDDGSTKEEWKMVNETKKILDPEISVTATCVRVPVFVGHCEAVNVEFERPISVDEARELLSEADGVVMYDDRKNGGYCTPIECAGEDGVFISRLRTDPTVPHGLNMWIVSDNLRKGAALNAVQIAEELVHNFGLAPKKAH
ncbi:MAG: aspartate-semialdehyde dehydrogenase [Rickettsiales bacterium]|nr:aspartate-semialdehyde dehydrogenase [Rickettsiales bacterium]